MTETLELLTERAEHLVASVAAATKQPDRPDYSPSEAVAFIRAAGYDLDYRLLRHLADLDRIPDSRGGRFSAAAVGHAIAYCERNRLWQPGHQYHTLKQTRWFLERHAAKASGDALPGLAACPLVGLLIMLANEPDANTRQALHECALAKLDALGTDIHG